MAPVLTSVRGGAEPAARASAARRSDAMMYRVCLSFEVFLRP